MLKAQGLSMCGRRGPVRRGNATLASLWLVGCVTVGLWLILGLHRAKTVESHQGTRELPVASLTSYAADAVRVYRPIESIRVGQRVITPDGDRFCRVPTAVDLTTWKKVTMRMVRVWDDDTRDDCEVQALEPPEWMAANHVRVGAKVPLPIDLGDLAEPDNPADVIAIDACPSIGDGPGRVVLTTVSHLNNFLFDLALRDQSGRVQQVDVTGWHKLFSESRGWVSTCTLAEGEVMRGRDGPLTVVSLVRQPGTYRVYNMTVEGEHVYYVSALDLLAHNAQDCDPTPNGGVAKPHGSAPHEQAIQDHMNNLPERAKNIRKNQVQVDANGRRVGNNRPDVQYDLDGRHYNFEADHDPARSSQHAREIQQNDPRSIVIQKNLPPQ